MLFVHGLTYDRRMWAPVIEQLNGAHTCVNLDLPGHGESPEAETYDLEVIARNIYKLVERLELARPIMIGHSIGAVIAAIYASRYPTAALVTSDQTLRLTPFFEQIQRIGEELNSPGFPRVWRRIENSLGIDLIPEQHRKLIKQGSRPRQNIVLGYWRGALSLRPAALQDQVDQCVRSITAPFTAIFGEDVDPDYLAWVSPTLPQCKVVVFPNTGHFPHLVAPDRFADEIRAIVRKAAYTRSHGLSATGSRPSS
jgi:pimeloyl-ACP methyl ester carboxylesterase